jgi:hypothetical protein
MPSLEPVEGNPFESKLEPVEGNPFESKAPDLASINSMGYPIPQAFINRLDKGTSVNRIMENATKSFKEGLGSEPVTGVSDETRQQMYDVGLLHDPTQGPAGPIHLFNDLALVQTPKAFETLMRGANAGLHGTAGAVGQLIDELRGDPESLGGTGSQAKREIINAGNWAMIEAGMGRFIRPGAAADHEIGTLPRDVDFENAAKVIGSDNALPKLKEAWQEQGMHPSELANDAQTDAFLRHDLSSAAAEPKDLPPDVPPSVQPLSAPGKLIAAARSAVDKTFDLAKDIQMQVSPMAVGNEVIPKAVAKDFANSLRRNSWDMDRWVADIDKRFTSEQQTRMFNALDEESVMRQTGEKSEHLGLSTLEPAERAEVELVMQHNLADWVHMADLDMVKGEPIPAYAARIATGVKSGEVQGSLPINSLGLNLKTSTARLKGRQYLSVDETEAALKAKYPEASIARNIKANVMAMKQERNAIAGRTLVENIKDYGRKIGDEQVAEGFKPSDEWFTIDHPALKTWRPKLEKAEDGSWSVVKSESGDTQFEQVPLYIHGDWEGPLRAVLSQKSGNVANALMTAKSKTMSLIMYSPFIHNAVIYSKALAGFKGNPIKTTKMYFDGNRIKNDPAQMIEAIDGGMVPIGKRFFNQDITDQLTEPSLTHGDSLTAKMVSAVPGLFSEGAEAATKSAIDKMGNFYHNTLLWDRVADLQAGTYAHFRDQFISSGMDRQTAVRMAAHEANRLAGSLPVESMSAGARTVANTLLFSRTFTLGNIGIMKDMFTGLPKDVLAQIERDAGPEALQTATSLARRQAFSTVVTDMALFYVGTSVMQNAVNVILGGSSLSDEANGYWTRLQKELAAKASNPWSAVPPWGIYSFLQGISATAGNEPGKQDRVLLGYSQDGTGIYGKSPMGRIGEEFSDYSQGFWRDLFLRKMGTIARPAWEIMSNDKGFGRKVFDPHIDSATSSLNAAWEISKVLVESQLPMTQMEAFGRLVKGEGDQKLNTLQTVGPFLPPPFTFTASKGAPGGPAVGEYYNAKSQQDFRVQQAMPGIRQMLQRGDTQNARTEMTRLNMDSGYQRWVEKTTQNPALRISPSGLRKFNQYATPEQRQRLENLRTPGPLSPDQ